MFILGGAIGGFIATHFMAGNKVSINKELSRQLATDFDIHNAGKSFLPPEIFSTSHLGDPYPLAILIVAGFLIGFYLFIRWYFFWNCHD